MNIPDFSNYGLALEPVLKMPGWFCGSTIERQQGLALASRLRTSIEAGQLQFFVGLLDDETGFRVYATPQASIRELVETFRVGEHGAQSYSMDAAETIERVATRLEAIQALFPFIVTDINNGWIEIVFTAKLTESDAAKIESLFPIDDAIKDGLDGYVSDYSGDGPLLAPRLLQEQVLQLWWH